MHIHSRCKFDVTKRGSRERESERRREGGEEVGRGGAGDVLGPLYRPFSILKV